MVNIRGDYSDTLEPKNDGKTITLSPYVFNKTYFIKGKKIILAKNARENNKMSVKIITPVLHIALATQETGK